MKQIVLLFCMYSAFAILQVDAGGLSKETLGLIGALNALNGGVVNRMNGALMNIPPQVPQVLPAIQPLVIQQPGIPVGQVAVPLAPELAVPLVQQPAFVGSLLQQPSGVLSQLGIQQPVPGQPLFLLLSQPNVAAAQRAVVPALQVQHSAPGNANPIIPAAGALQDSIPGRARQVMSLAELLGLPPARATVTPSDIKGGEPAPLDASPTEPAAPASP
ncbi:uncharacterized protein LOC120527063 isoform X2 [Polypterus senegalus]|uniref:Secretory calcium-binding phosphoprotein 9 variant 2 n=1 Tax=Polypterus senegalus TaxID=55291 RepID=A0A286SFI9_POLSE|nr:uncharacterized protein LOC120527063 isoform X2 [Polypterus senegalus]ATA58044.1 secretory calcium-binding phosphoprotein 9 variant 2 [Polypterus senegalus]